MSQGAVEVIKIPQVIKGCARQELVGVALDGEGKTAGRKAVVVVMLKAMQGTGFVRHDQPAAFQDGKLFGVGLGRFVAAHARPPEMSNPPIWALLRGLAGIAGITIGRIFAGVKPENGF